MYRKIDPPVRMTVAEMSEQFPTEYAIFRYDQPHENLSVASGIVMYVGDNQFELRALSRGFDPDWDRVLEDFAVVKGNNVKKEYILDGVYTDEGNNV